VQDGRILKIYSLNIFLNYGKFKYVRGEIMRSQRAEIKIKRKKYIKNLLWLFLVIIPLTAVVSSFALDYVMNIGKEKDTPIAAVKPVDEEINDYKYSFSISSKELYRVEIKKYDKYEDAEALIVTLKNKKLNGFIIKEQGYLTFHGIYLNKSQAENNVKYLKKKGIQASVNSVNINGFGISYTDIDKTLIDLAKATDKVILSIVEEKADLSLKIINSKEKIGGANLGGIIENETKLTNYLKYLQDTKTSKKTSFYKVELEELIKEVLADRLFSEDNYNYYELQNSLINQVNAFQKFYNSLVVY